MTEMFHVVNSNDQPVGTATKQDLWEKGLYHRFVSVLIEDESGKLLCQLRSPNLQLHPNRWTVSTTGHVNADEDYITAAVRELQEEMGVQTPLTFVDKVFITYIDGTKKLMGFVSTFKGKIASTTELILQADEVTKADWFEIADLKRQIADHPDNFTPTLTDAIERYYDKPDY